MRDVVVRKRLSREGGVGSVEVVVEELLAGMFDAAEGDSREEAVD